MARKKNPPSAPSLAEKIETAVREAVAAVPGINDVTELAYCHAVDEALVAVQVGIRMRIDELDPEDDDGDD